MATRAGREDVELLATIAECGVLTFGQLAVLSGRNSSAMRRRLGKLRKLGLIRAASGGLSKGPGRPTELVSLAVRGVRWLKEQGALAADTPDDQVTAEKITCLDHQLLTNEFRAQLCQLHNMAPVFSVQFLAPTSPMIKRDRSGHPIIHEQFGAVEGGGDRVDFTPDGVFSVTHSGLGKTLLFFLEVDMDTQTLASRRSGKKDVHQKLLNYQAYLRCRRYKRYEGIWKCSLGVPRLLFVANEPSRMEAICRLVVETPPSGFVWVTDQTRLSIGGVWGLIWAPGGNLGVPQQSILGSAMPIPAPTPASLAGVQPRAGGVARQACSES